MSVKMRLTIYLTQEDKEIVRDRSDAVGKSMSEYVAELVMWDKRLQLVENARRDTIQISDLNIPKDKEAEEKKE